MPVFHTEKEKILEAVLFASGDALSADKLAEIIETDTPAARGLLLRMAGMYAAEGSGIQLHEAEDTFRLCTNPKYYEFVQKLPGKPPFKPLTAALLETLAIVAFKQPVTKSLIEDIRGVNADHAVNRLMEYGLIVETGRLDAPGKPILFGTSEEFLRYYGMNSLENFLENFGIK